MAGPRRHSGSNIAQKTDAIEQMHTVSRGQTGIEPAKGSAVASLQKRQALRNKGITFRQIKGGLSY